jgi:hypothetical protein
MLLIIRTSRYHTPFDNNSPMEPHEWNGDSRKSTKYCRILHQLPRTDILIFHRRACKGESKRTSVPKKIFEDICRRLRWIRNGHGRGRRGRERAKRERNDEPFKRTAAAIENSDAVVEKLAWQDWIPALHTHEKPCTNPRTIGRWRNKQNIELLQLCKEMVQFFFLALFDFCLFFCTKVCLQVRLASKSCKPEHMRSQDDNVVALAKFFLLFFLYLFILFSFVSRFFACLLVYVLA